MLLRQVCRNRLHKHDFWEIIKSKIRHSYEANTYLMHIGFARWFQRIESLFRGNWANGVPLEKNAHANFPKAEIAAYQCMENGGGKHAHIEMFFAHCACRVQCWYKVKDLDGSLEKMLNVFTVLLVTRTLSNCTINVDNQHTSTIQLYEEVPPSLIRQLHVVCFPYGHEKNMGTYGYTKWTCSQSSTVIERTISDLQA